MHLFSADAKMFLKTLKTPKVAHNWLGLAVFSPASFCFVKLRQFYILKRSHLWSCQTLQDEKIAHNFYDAGTIAFHYVVLNYLYSGRF